MMPLGYIHSYANFDEQFRQLVEERNQKGRAFGFLFDDSRLTLKKSGLTEDARAIRDLNDVLGEDITIFFLRDSTVRIRDPEARRQYLERINAFNRRLIATLGVPEQTIRLPCLILFRVQDGICSHVRAFSLDACSQLYLVSDMLDGISSYREFIAGDRVDAPPNGGRTMSIVGFALPIVELVNAVGEFATRATQALGGFLP